MAWSTDGGDHWGLRQQQTSDMAAAGTAHGAAPADAVSDAWRVRTTLGFVASNAVVRLR